ncbi:hypothetical protein Pelo_17636 [Pelomyxa schiedti]|nr:hypothetical protein Pelo_17636 [Pelomyxa schiedti]
MQFCRAPPDVKGATHARSQFIALGVGAIVGRCGGSSPASALSPSSLSLIGREWVVFPARHVIISAETDATHHEVIMFSVSPTLGLVDQPATIYTSTLSANFCGWVGPLSHNGAPRHGDMMIPVKMYPFGYYGYTSRRWFCIHNWWVSAFSVWNCDGIESGCVPTHLNVALPGALKSAAFDGDGSLVVLLEHGGAVAIDLEATWEQKRFSRGCSTGADGGGPTVQTVFDEISHTPITSGWMSTVSIQDATFARSQFIALGVGAIVGRCGCSSPASALSPASLSTIGREWIVVPGRHVVIAADRNHQRKFITFSVSPTLGLVDQPATLGNRFIDFRGWLGPQSHNGLPMFALVLEEGRKLCVVDAKGHSDVEIPVALHSFGCRVCTSRRWFCVHNWWANAFSVWNCDDIGSGSVPPHVNLAAPWAMRSATFDGERYLVVSLKDGGAMAVDLEATLEQKRLVSSTLLTGGDLQIESLICWKGVTYAFPSGKGCFMVCLNTGQRVPLPEGKAQPIGGPYFVVTHSDGEELSSCSEVHSVVEPTKVFFTHRNLQPAGLHFGNEMVVRNARNCTDVIDAVTGFVVFKLGNLYVVKVS